MRPIEPSILEYGPITVKQVFRDIYEATVQVTKPLKMEVNMKGRGEEIARQKLELFLQNKPYQHLDDLKNELK